MKKLLLHICCAPCSSAIIEDLVKNFNFDITVYFYNPNIFPESEFRHRCDEIEGFYQRFPYAKNVKTAIDKNYNYQEYLNAIDIKNSPELAKEDEKGERCRRCYYFRMKKAYEYAITNNFDYFTTSLSISPYKDFGKIIHIGRELNKQMFLDYIFINLFERSRELSKEYNLYRQQYCGCSFSQRTAVSD